MVISGELVSLVFLLDVVCLAILEESYRVVFARQVFRTLAMQP